MSLVVLAPVSAFYVRIHEKEGHICGVGGGETELVILFLETAVAFWEEKKGG